MWLTYYLQYLGLSELDVTLSPSLSKGGHFSLPRVILAACLALPRGSHVLGTDRRPGRVQSGSCLPHTTLLSATAPQKRSSFPLPSCPMGCLLLQVQAPRGRSRYHLIIEHILQDEPGLSKLLARKPQATSHGSRLVCVVTRSLFPTWEACPCFLSEWPFMTAAQALMFCVKVSEGPGAGPPSSWPRQSNQF